MKTKFFDLFKRKRQTAPEPEPTDTLGYLSRFYETRCDEDARLLSLPGQVEFRTTMRYIERYLQPGMRVLEIGAATGRYSLTIARKGYDVTAIELVQHNIDVFRKKLKPGDRVNLQQGNALDLSRFADDTFDVTLLLGPMYHLYTKEDQLRALQEALRVTKPGGLLYAAYAIADMSILTSGIWPKTWFWDYLEDGHIDPKTYACKRRFVSDVPTGGYRCFGRTIARAAAALCCGGRRGAFAAQSICEHDAGAVRDLFGLPLFLMRTAGYDGRQQP